MKSNNKILPIIIINIIALLFVIIKLPDIVPTHIGLNMQIDAYGSKWTIMFMGMIPLFIYLSLNHSILKKLKTNENYNYRNELIISTLSIILIIFLNWIFVFIGFQNKVGESTIISFPIGFLLVFLMGLFITISSNYFGTIKQNRALGIRVPWTLKSESNWRKTHRLAGYTGVVGGIMMIIFSVISLITNTQIYLIIGLILGGTLSGVIPIIYSFMIYKHE